LQTTPAARGLGGPIPEFAEEDGMSLFQLTRRRVLQAAAGLGLWPRGALAEPAPSLAFLAIGDWGRGGQFHQGEVAAQMEKTAARLDVRFVVSVGDNFYPDGVQSADDPQWRSSFEDVYAGASLQVPWWAALGNHDHHGSPEAQIAYARKSPRWRMPGRTYVVNQRTPDGAGLDLFFLDTTPFATSGGEAGDPAPKAAEAEAQLGWLDRALAGSVADWKLVIGHHPVFSGGEHGDTLSLAERLAPLLERRGVHAYLNGHDHDLQHVEVRKVAYLTTGSGSKVRPTAARAGTVFCSDSPGFLAVQADRARLRFSFWSASGAVLHEAAIASGA
jgi:acid phosphatase